MKAPFGRLFSPVICLLLVPSLTSADNSTFSGYFEAGKKSQAEDFEEEDDDRGYTYQNYHLKFQQKLSERLNYELGSFIYSKDYKSSDSLDNISRILNAKASNYITKQKTQFLLCREFLFYSCCPI